jgi:thioesterase domain-containing protein
MLDYYAALTDIYSGKIIFFSATEATQLASGMEKTWDGYLKGDMVIYKIPGNHITITTSPYIETIAVHIQSFMSNLRKK